MRYLLGVKRLLVAELRPRSVIVVGPEAMNAKDRLRCTTDWKTAAFPCITKRTWPLLRSTNHNVSLTVEESPTRIKKLKLLITLLCSLSSLFLQEYINIEIEHTYAIHGGIQGFRIKAPAAQSRRNQNPCEPAPLCRKSCSKQATPLPICRSSLLSLLQTLHAIIHLLSSSQTLK